MVPHVTDLSLDIQSIKHAIFVVSGQAQRSLGHRVKNVLGERTVGKADSGQVFDFIGQKVTDCPMGQQK